MPASATDSVENRTVADAVRQAIADKTPLCIRGGNTKSFYGRHTDGAILDTEVCAGIVNYAPTELVITARAGTKLSELQAVLGERNQMFAFEPPAFGAGATIGGVVASGLSGPRRAYAGALRDFLLGVRIVNGQGEILRFGGEVMKNVAGYDVSRLMAGAMGTLGIITEVSLKVLPKPPVEQTLGFDLDADEAILRLNRWAGQPLPLSASCYDGNKLYVRLSGSVNGVRSAIQKLAADSKSDAGDFWLQVREQQTEFFQSAMPLWRVSLAPATPMLDLPGRWLIEWGGAQRWLLSDDDPSCIRSVVRETGGHATLFRGGDRQGDVFEPLSPILLRIHRNLKDAFDPHRLLNPGRLYREF
ncbi:MAG: glycolate oxidase subunit GlcE [Gammaproteobacteria bacterium]|nr:glycolate oxidase subunit GlcE [Gammaproteobacteria bacterium]